MTTDIKKAWWTTFLVCLLTAIYWTYLIFASKMDISADAIDFEYLGRLLREHGLKGYLVGGPHREWLFPWTISFSMTVANSWNGSYQYVQKFLHLGVVLFSQIILALLMRRLKMSTVVMAGTLLYFGFSPAVVNSGMSLFSEILSYPFVLLIVSLAVKFYQKDNIGLGEVLVLAVGSALSVLGFIFVKAAFEIGYVVYFSPFFILAIVLWIKGNKRKGLFFLIFYFCVIFIVAGMCHIYKQVNLNMNGHYSITDDIRGPRAIYGNASRRTEPLSIEKVKLALVSVPGQGVCRKFFTDQACESWFFAQSDSIGDQHFSELARSGEPISKIGHRAVKDAIGLVQEHPFRYALFYGIDLLNNFFWESTNIGFVTYPLWLQKIYQMEFFKDGLRLLLSFLTALALVYNFFLLWGNAIDRNQRLVLAWSLWMIFIWATLLSFISILTRYIFPIVPLFLLQIGFAWHHLSSRLASNQRN